MKQPKHTAFSAGLKTRQITRPVQFCIIAAAIPTVGFLHFLHVCIEECCVLEDGEIVEIIRGN